MYAIAIHGAVAGRCTFIGVQLGQGTGRFRNVREEVERTTRVIQVGTWVRLERMNHVRELDGVTDEECWEVVAYQIPVAVSSVELGGKAARVAQGFR